MTRELRNRQDEIERQRLVIIEVDGALSLAGAVPFTESAVMTDATFKNAFVDFEIEYELDFNTLQAKVMDAASSLEVPERRHPSADAVRDIHDAVRAAIEDAFEDYHWAMNRAWRALKRALRGTAES